MTRPNNLYRLLPGYYRERDVKAGRPLEALLDVLDDELRTLEQNVQTLYDDWFIETCQPRIVPYIGDLVGVSDGPGGEPPSRAEVANAIATRRRKGTRGALEAAIRDTTGWAVSVVEHPPKRIVEITEEIDVIVGPDEIEVDVTEAVRTWIRTPFGSRVEEQRHQPGRRDRGGVSIYIWRAHCAPVEWTTAHHAGGAGFTFDPAGMDRPLFNPAERPGSGYSPATARELPIRLTRAALHRDLEHRRHGGTRHGAPPRDPVVRIAVRRHARDRAWHEIPESRMHACDLLHWHAPATEIEWDVAVDPELGRMLFRTQPAEVVASWCAVWPWVVRGATEERAPRDAVIYPVRRTWSEGKHHLPPFTSVRAAIEAWQKAGGAGVIRILDSARYDAPDHVIHLPPGASIALEADAGEMPCLGGVWRFRATSESGALRLEGLRFDGAIETRGPIMLAMDRCLVEPRARHRGEHDHGEREASLRAVDSQHPVEFRVTRSVCGPIELPLDSGTLVAIDSIVDGERHVAIRASVVRLYRCTVFGAVEVHRLEDALDTIFAGPVSAGTTHGELRFCALPAESRAPAAQHCFWFDEERHIERWFSSLDPAHPGYARLLPNAPAQIRTGASDDGEMGAGHELREGSRWARIERVLDEFLPFGVAADVFFLT